MARRGFTYNTRAPKGSYAIPPGSPVGGRGHAKYPINTIARARNAISRVQQHGSPAERRMVFAAIRRRYPALARRSSVIPTRGGTGKRKPQHRPRKRRRR